MSDQPCRIVLASTDPYSQFVDQVGDALRAEGHTLGPTTAETVEKCINLTGERLGLKAPPRLPIGAGGKRAGAGRPKAVKVD